MDWISVRKAASFLLPFACLAFFFAASFGVMHIGMTTDDHGHMHSCPFMGMTAICDMSPLEHVSAWQSAYATIILTDMLGALLSVLVLAFAWIVLSGAKPLYICSTVPVRRADYAELLFYSRPLKDALMRGIVHPKPY